MIHWILRKMELFGLSSHKSYRAGLLVATAGEGSVYTVDGDKSLLLKILTRPLTTRQVEKLNTLAAFTPKPDHSAIPIEVVIDPATRTPVGFVQPFFTRSIPLTRVLDSHGRTAQKLPDDLTFRVKLCRLLAEAFARVHATNLVIGDVSDGNFLLGQDWLGRASIIYAIDCNSFQITIRTNHGNECFPSGVATEEYAAPEVQSTDWSTSLRSVYSDSFGFAVLAWKLIFGGSHPFAVITPRTVDVPPLGERIEKRLFPFCPGAPMPSNWKAPAIEPSLSVLPVEVRELFFRTLSSADPRDRATAEDWCQVLRSWEFVLTPSLPFRLIGAWNESISGRLAETLSKFKPYLGPAFVLASLVTLTLLTARLDFSWSTSPTGSMSPLHPNGTSTRPLRFVSNPPRTKVNRPREVDPQLFPEPIWKPSETLKE
jgi:DNA-binding helix-hairpin-helix protein with protein kinase domain